MTMTMTIRDHIEDTAQIRVHVHLAVGQEMKILTASAILVDQELALFHHLGNDAVVQEID
jgi:hypothetical protein